jgi:HEPN domain-containing protein
MNKTSNKEWRVFFIMAKSHLIVVKKLLRKNTTGKLTHYDLIVYYHLYRAVELLLKSFLLYKGSDRNEVKAYRHNLIDIVFAAQNKGLIINGELLLNIGYINQYYDGKEFEYTSVKSMKLPKYEKVIDLVKELYLDIGNLIKKA